MRIGIVKFFETANGGGQVVTGDRVVAIRCATFVKHVERGIVSLYPKGETPPWPVPGEQVKIGTLLIDGEDLQALYWSQHDGVTNTFRPRNRAGKDEQHVLRAVIGRDELKAGIVKSFDPRRGFGFILTPAGDRDVFFHAQRAADHLPDGSLSLRPDSSPEWAPKEGQRILFVPIELGRKLRAELWCVAK